MTVAGTSFRAFVFVQKHGLIWLNSPACCVIIGSERAGTRQGNGGVAHARLGGVLGAAGSIPWGGETIRLLEHGSLFWTIRTHAGAVGLERETF